MRHCSPCWPVSPRNLRRRPSRRAAIHLSSVPPATLSRIHRRLARRDFFSSLLDAASSLASLSRQLSRQLFPPCGACPAPASSPARAIAILRQAARASLRGIRRLPSPFPYYRLVRPYILLCLAHRPPLGAFPRLLSRCLPLLLRPRCPSRPRLCRPPSPPASSFALSSRHFLARLG